mmetsp:Transcript_27632/g.52299  ORF Transcript_27632/g.52299 Transcript_27632/m.52299 type:complete len:320 (+) Transcript_27632:1819-2778(+)
MRCVLVARFVLGRCLHQFVEYKRQLGQHLRVGVGLGEVVQQQHLDEMAEGPGSTSLSSGACFQALTHLGQRRERLLPRLRLLRLQRHHEGELFRLLHGMAMRAHHLQQVLGFLRIRLGPVLATLVQLGGVAVGLVGEQGQQARLAPLARVTCKIQAGLAVVHVPPLLRASSPARLEEGVREHELEHTSALRRVRGGVPAKNGELLHGPRPLLRGGVRLLRVQEASHQILHMQARAAGVLRLQQLGHRARARQLVEAAPTKSLQSRRHRHPRLGSGGWLLHELHDGVCALRGAAVQVVVLLAQVVHQALHEALRQQRPRP